MIRPAPYKSSSITETQKKPPIVCTGLSPLGTTQTTCKHSLLADLLSDLKQQKLARRNVQYAYTYHPMNALNTRAPLICADIRPPGSTLPSKKTSPVTNGGGSTDLTQHRLARIDIPPESNAHHLWSPNKLQIFQFTPPKLFGSHSTSLKDFNRPTCLIDFSDTFRSDKVDACYFSSDSLAVLIFGKHRAAYAKYNETNDQWHHLDTYETSPSLTRYTVPAPDNMWLFGDSPYEEDNDDHFFDIRRLINSAITRSDWRLTEILLKARVDSGTVLMDVSVGESPIPLLIEKHNNELQQQKRNANIIIAELLTKHYLLSIESTSFSQQWHTDDLCQMLCQTIKKSDIKLWKQFFSENYFQLDLHNIINLESLFKTPLERSLYYATVRAANKNNLKTGSIAKPLQDALVEITRQGKSTLIATVIDMLSPRERDRVFSIIDEDQMTLLHHATKNNHIHIVRNLVLAGAKNIEAGSVWKTTPLHSVLEQGYSWRPPSEVKELEPMATLLARAGYYDIKGDAPQRDLWESIHYPWDDKIACILLTDLYKKNNPHVNFTCMLGMATKRFSNTVLRHIIHRNIISLDHPLYTLYAGWRSPLLYAIDFNNTEAAMMLIEANADIEAEHEKTVSFPLKAAAYHNNIHVTKALIDKGANVNKSITMTPTLQKYLKKYYHDGVTPRHSVYYDPPDLPEYYTYSTPLWAATAKNHEAIVSLLLNAGADPNHDGESTLFAIEKNTSINIAAMLIEAGASFTRKACGTSHILSRAYKKQHTPLCALLLNLGISQNTIDEHRWAILDNEYLEKDQCRRRKQYQGVFRLFNQWLKFPNISPNDMSLAERCRFICRKQMGKRVMNLYCVNSPIALDVFKKYSPPKPGTPPGIMDYLAYHTEIL